MKQKYPKHKDPHAIHKITIAIATISLISCGGNENTQNNVKADSVNQLGKPYIISESTLAEKSALMVSGEYFIAPPVEYSTVGTVESADDAKVNDDGHNYLAFSNIFSSEIKNLKLGFYYNSNNSLDRFNNIIGSWRTSYNSYMDFAIDYQNLDIRSATYATPRDACESGFNDIKNTLYRGLIANAETVFDTNKQRCVVRLNGEDAGTFPVWNISGGIVGNYHYLSKPSGEVLIFEPEGNGYVADDRGIQVSMQVLEDGRYEYIDAEGVVYTYANNGTLETINFEGQITQLSYDENSKVISVNGPLDNQLNFTYNSNQTLASITSGQKKITLTYNANTQLTSIDLLTDKTLLDKEYDFETCTENCIELNADGTVKTNNADISGSDMQNGLTREETTSTVNIANLSYNNKGLLSRFYRQAWQDEENPDIKIDAEDITFTYDAANRVIEISNLSGGHADISYTPDRVTRSFDSGKKSIRNISYNGSRQQVTQVDDDESTLQGEYNNDGQLTHLSLTTEIQAEDGDNITAQSTSEKQLDMAFAYDARGRLARVEYETLATGKRFVQMEYATRYPKPTKVLTDEQVTFFDIDQNGQLIRRTSVRFDKSMHLRAASIGLNEIRQMNNRQDITFEYDADGFLKRTNDLKNQTSTDYSVDKEGIVAKKTHLRENSFGSWNDQYALTLLQGWSSQTGSIDATSANVQTVWVSGFMDTPDNAIPTLAALSQNKDGYDNYKTWFDLDYLWLEGDLPTTTDPFGKRREKLIVIGYSWGGDSAVEASKKTSADKNVDLLITIDPIGIGDYNAGANHWIMVYAMAGRPLGGYFYLRKGETTISIPYFGCKRKGWRIKCGWKHKKISIPYWYPDWKDTLKWDQSDWIAFAGGKGTYSSYEYAQPNQKIKLTAHHGDSGYLVWALEHGITHKTNNEFKLNINADITENGTNKEKYNNYTSLQRKYNDKPTDFGINLWK